MSEAKTYLSTPLRAWHCPSCGASLKPEGSHADITCPYCGTTVVVPKELREPPAPVAPATSQMPQDQELAVLERLTEEPTASSGRSGLLGCLVLFVLLAIGFVLSGILYVNPSSLDQVIQRAPIGYARVEQTFGGEGTGPGLFQDARQIAVDGSGNLFVSDFNTQRLQKFNAAGRFDSGWMIQEEGKYKNKYGPDALAADRAGNLYVLWTGLILKYDGATGKFLDKFTGQVLDSFTKQTDSFKSIAALPDGGLLALSDARNSDDLVRLDAKGKAVSRIKQIVSGQVAEAFISVSDLHVAVDGLGTIFVLYNGTRDPAVLKYTPEGKYVSRFGGKGEAAGQFDNPRLIAVDNQSRVYVGDFKGIQVFDGNGRYLDVIKSGSFGYSAFGMAIDDKNDLFVVGGKSQVYKFVLNEKK